jgi:hypothetical protein
MRKAWGRAAGIPIAGGLARGSVQPGSMPPAPPPVRPGRALREQGGGAGGIEPSTFAGGRLMNRNRQIRDTAPYKNHFACFRCRKAFKRRWPSDCGREELPDGRPFPCPECGEAMKDMGIDFKAPPRRARRQWIKVAVLFSFGVRFDSRFTQSRGPGPRPVHLNEVQDYLVSLGHTPEDVNRRIDAVTKALSPSS